MTQQSVSRRPLGAGRLVVLAWTLVACASLAAATLPATLVETPMLREEVGAKKLPPVKQRLPDSPLVVAMDGKTSEPGQHGGTLNMLIGRARDVRMLVVYGYARLIGYDRNMQIAPDLLESIDVKEDRIFTMKLRAGHKWSDGQPFTSDREVTNLPREYNDRALSLRVGRSVWQVCTDSDFRGHCETFDRDVRDLRQYGMDRGVSSMRPVQ